MTDNIQITIITDIMKNVCKFKYNSQQKKCDKEYKIAQSVHTARAACYKMYNVLLIRITAKLVILRTRFTLRD